MYAIDFNYDGLSLGDFGFLICDFSPSDGANISENGTLLQFTKVSHNSGKIWGLSNTKYDSCIQTTFDICKNPDVTSPDKMEITDDEYRDIVRWLNRREFKKMFFIYDDTQNRDFRYYNASFNVSKIKISEVLYGIRLTMETDKPFGYGEDIKYNWTVLNSVKKFKLTDFSDEIGYIYPTIKITCYQSGDLFIVNDKDENTTIINNCSTDEVVTINGESQIIHSSFASHNIQNDFNYEFPKIINSISDRDNYFSFSLPCMVELSYVPIVKDVPNI